MKLASYWHDTAAPFAGAAPGPVEGRVDVAVVGFTGLSAALALAKRGARVAVLEADHVGAGASGRNGGQCNNGFFQDFATMEARFGFERAVALYRAFDAAVDTVERIVSEERIDCGFARTGKLKLAAKPEHYDKLACARDALHRGADPDVSLMPREALGAELGSDGFHGGAALPEVGQHDGLYYSMGYSGHGTEMATHMGQAMAAVMAGDRDANPWGGLDWPAIAGHFGPPWFLPLVGAWYRLQDRLH